MKKAVTAVLGIAVVGLLLFWLKTSSVVRPAAQTEQSHSESKPAPVASLAAPAPVHSAGISARDRKLLADLNQIFASKNDNDPRLDTEFKNLTPGTKDLLIQRYKELPMEARNERGTIVFLIGRELTRPEDFNFLSQVATEPPCLSLGDCKKEGLHSEEDVHEEVTISVTLAYPQHVAEKSVENLLNRMARSPSDEVDPTRVDEAFATLDKMSESPVISISRKAAELQAGYAGLRNRN